ncbi:MAG: sulfurtransferase TusA family protein [Synergistaceae bacterium]|nr:sulfurtransferase TusA family protein [Synergistaceae bacterium]
MKTIDACGISCPEPLLRLREALKGENEIVLLVDNKIALENCERYAKKEGYSVNSTNDGDIYKIHVSGRK